ncbi:hypothetical protein Tsubulata_037027 [Turnera subulata]|uniref:Uncharacterized protein n=1 Tax=Turnera subulata TaxID=218843 RepID=A0A9Q0GM97_9ROSI|nr:hypothetical protein Tsubulata_037027 [Turnera subulata]
MLNQWRQQSLLMSAAVLNRWRQIEGERVRVGLRVREIGLARRIAGGGVATGVAAGACLVGEAASGASGFESEGERV